MGMNLYETCQSEKVRHSFFFNFLHSTAAQVLKKLKSSINLVRDAIVANRHYGLAGAQSYAKASPLRALTPIGGNTLLANIPLTPA